LAFGARSPPSGRAAAEIDFPGGLECETERPPGDGALDPRKRALGSPEDRSRRDRSAFRGLPDLAARLNGEEMADDFDQELENLENLLQRYIDIGDTRYDRSMLPDISLRMLEAHKAVLARGCRAVRNAGRTPHPARGCRHAGALLRAG